MIKCDFEDLISARTWAVRWDCSISSIRRAAKRFKIRTVYVGDGRNGLVRYSLSDILRVEREHGFTTSGEVAPTGSVVSRSE